MARKPVKSRRARPEDVKAAADRAEARAKGKPIKSAKKPIDPPIVPAAEIAAEIHRGRGRPASYKPAFAARAAELCSRGATNFELGQEFGVTTSTIWRWTVAHADFRSAVHGAKEAFDDRVERSLAERAIGYSYDSQKVFCHLGIVTKADIVEHIPPDVGAAKLWLTNRRPKDWAETTKQELTGKDGKAIEVKSEPPSKLELARWLAFELAKATASTPSEG